MNIMKLLFCIKTILFSIAILLFIYGLIGLFIALPNSFICTVLSSVFSMASTGIDYERNIFKNNSK
jgi:hypothetical protein